MEGADRTGIHGALLGRHVQDRLAGRLDDDLEPARSRDRGSRSGRARVGAVRRLSYRWHTFTPELAKSLELNEETRERIAAEQRSKVTFEIEPHGDR